LIPNTALAAMLITVGIKLAHPKEFIHVFQIGKEQLAITTIALHALLLGWFVVLWFQKGCESWHLQGPELYASSDSHFSIGFFFDGKTVVYGSMTVILTFLVLIFSRFYIHREKGFKRFFNNILFFYTGLCFILFAGNLETIFIGWEIIGVSSFFLIAFY